MPISAEAGVMPALVNASLTFSIASGGVTTYQPEPSSFKSSAPASSTMSNILSSLACSLGTTISPLRWNIQPTAPASARLPPFLLIKCRNSPTTRLRLVVTAWISIPTPPGPYPSNVTSSYCSPSSWPVPRKTARSMFSFGIFSFLPARMAARSRGLELGSPPPMRAAMVISRITRVNTRPRLASVAAFLCLMVAHFECPDMRLPRFDFSHPSARDSTCPRPAAVCAGESSPVRRPTRARGRHADHDAETYSELQNPAEPQQFSTAACAAKRVYSRLDHPYCIAKTFFRD